jgi:hypothetical protein
MTIEYLNPPYQISIKRLEWQKQGLQQTTYGYGSRLTTEYMLHTPDGMVRRVYAACYSNAASFYVLLKGKQVFLRDGELQEARDKAQI